MFNLKKWLMPVIAIVLFGYTTMNAIAQPNNDLETYLKATQYIDSVNKDIVDTVATLTSSVQSQREKAVLIHNYVRDRIQFGFEPDFYAMKASEVLRAQRGYCNTKSTLFIAMLRAAHIPARHRFYSLSSNVLNGVLDPGTKYVDHSIVEVYLDDKWVKTDSYIVDPALFSGAQSTLQAPLGLGIRLDGSVDWDGINASFSQYHESYINKEFGVYEDISDFYKNANNAHNKLNFIIKFFVGTAFNKANARLNKLRRINQ